MKQSIGALGRLLTPAIRWLLHASYRRMRSSTDLITRQVTSGKRWILRIALAGPGPDGPEPASGIRAPRPIRSRPMLR